MLETAGILMAVFLFLGFLGLWGFSLIWAYRDAELRGKSGILVALLVAFLHWPISLLVWMVFRPDILEKK